VDLSATPTAQNVANNPASTPGPSPGKVAPIELPIEPPVVLESVPIKPPVCHQTIPKPEQKPIPQTRRNGSTPIRNVNGGKRKTSAVKSAPRLSVTETHYQGKKAWRVSLGKRGQNLLSFRVRPINSGYAVTWRSGNSERYVCYLAASEWRSVRRENAAGFASLIAGKLNARYAAGEDTSKLSGLCERVQAFQ
jgi:hypothetical protein